MMLLDSKIPTRPPGSNAAGTAPNGCAARNSGVLNSRPRKPVRPETSTAPSTPFARSASVSGRASKSHSQSPSAPGAPPRVSTSTPDRRPAMTAFQTRGFGR